MQTVARVNLMGLGCGDGPTTDTTPASPTGTVVVPSVSNITLPLLPTLSQAPGSQPTAVTDTGSLCGVIDWMALNPLSVVVIGGLAAWLFANVTKGGK